MNKIKYKESASASIPSGTLVMAKQDSPANRAMKERRGSQFLKGEIGIVRIINGGLRVLAEGDSDYSSKRQMLKHWEILGRWYEWSVVSYPSDKTTSGVASSFQSACAAITKIVTEKVTPVFFEQTLQNEWVADFHHHDYSYDVMIVKRKC